MRLLYVCNDFGIAPSGTKGSSVHLRAITRALANLGHEVLLLSPREGPGDDHPARCLLPPGCPPGDESTRLLAQYLAEHGFESTFAQELRPLMYSAWVRDRALEALRDQHVDAVLERLALFSTVGGDLADALDVPLVLEVNAILTEEARAFRRLQLAELGESIETRLLQRADALAAMSEALAERLVARGVRPQRVQVIPNGVDLEAFAETPPHRACRAALGLRDEFVVGFVGSLKVWHGVDILITAFAKLTQEDPAARLLIVGTGPMEHELRSTARSLGIEGAVIFTGNVEHPGVPALLRAMDVAVAPFRSIDGFYFSPIKLFEYMAAGVCVIASRLGQIRQVIEDGVSGLLCRPDDALDLLAKLQRLRQSPELRSRLAANAFNVVRRRYTWAHAGQKTEQIIRAAVAQRNEAETAGPPEIAASRVTRLAI
ncbi:MAG TPA: glycosyltransferase family 4 protein [Phycisphaerae bacterium]